MLCTGKFTFFAAQARNISKMCFWQETEFGIKRLCLFTVKMFFAVYYCFSLGMTFEEIFFHKGVGFVSTSVIYRALPCVQTVI